MPSAVLIVIIEPRSTTTPAKPITPNTTNMGYTLGIIVTRLARMFRKATPSTRAIAKNAAPKLLRRSSNNCRWTK